ncbi:hypothetical protein [Streptomyces sp. NPDC058664]|uniref:hypothetical protein n=1 Tax=unclassified Streptomyces TaxID=2593676 RepID=UPI00365A6B3A
MAHPTVHGVVLSPDRPRFTTQLDPSRPWSGDGTVPRESSFAKWALDYEEDAMWNGYRHADMAGGGSVGHQLSVIREGRRTPDMLAADEGFGLEVPECALAGEPFEVLATGPDLAGRNLRATLTREGAAPAPPVPFAPDGADGMRAVLEGGPGTWVLEVHSERPRRVCREVVTLVDPAGGGPDTP